MIDEIWKPVVGYEGLYEISNFGRVKSKKRIVKNFYKNRNRTQFERMLSVSKKKRYFTVNLYKNGSRKTHAVHRLVATAFVENKNNFDQINHVDGNKHNNCFENLEWCSHKQNIKHAVENKLHKFGENHPRAKLSKRDVLQIKEFYKDGDSVKILSEKFNISSAVIYQIINNNAWKHLEMS